MHPTLKWILACRNRGGFGLFPGDGPCLLGTYCALSALKLFSEPVPDAGDIARFILGKQNPDHGFCNRFGRWPAESALVNTFYAIKSLEILGYLPKNPADILQWIHSRQQKDGGYLWDYWLPPEDKARSGLKETWYAVSSLVSLGSRPENGATLASFLHDRQAQSFLKDGSFNNKADLPNDYTPAATGLTVFTGMGLNTLQLLGLAPLNVEKSMAYLQGNQQPDGGVSKGLGVFKAYDDRRVCRMPEAYYALPGLKALKNPKGLAQWVGQCLNPDGGYSRMPDGSPPDMESTFQALSILRSLGEDFPCPENPASVAGAAFFNRFQGPCAQVFTEDPDELRYLSRWAAFLFGRGGPSFELAKRILFFINDHLLFCSNYKQSSAEILIDGFATCGPQGRAYVGLACAAGIPSRMVYVFGHGCSESLIDGKWVLMDPMFFSVGADEKGNLKSALEIREHFLNGGEGWTRFGDWRYEHLKIQQPDGTLREI